MGISSESSNQDKGDPKTKPLQIQLTSLKVYPQASPSDLSLLSRSLELAIIRPCNGKPRSYLPYLGHSIYPLPINAIIFLVFKIPSSVVFKPLTGATSKSQFSFSWRHTSLMHVPQTPQVSQLQSSHAEVMQKRRGRKEKNCGRRAPIFPWI